MLARCGRIQDEEGKRKKMNSMGEKEVFSGTCNVKEEEEEEEEAVMNLKIRCFCSFIQMMLRCCCFFPQHVPHHEFM